MNAARKSIATIDPVRRADVIGAGIGGLTAALALARLGIETRIYEQAAALTETGAGIQITPNGLRLLDRLGVGIAIRLAGVPARGLAIHAGLSGRLLAQIPFDESHYIFIYRPDLIDILCKAAVAAGAELVSGSRVAAKDLGGDLIVAADGVHSAERLLLNPGQTTRFSGLVAYRATFEAEGDEPPFARIWTAPSGHVVSYPIGSRVNLVAVAATPHWTETGWSHPADPARFRADLAGFSSDVQALLDRAKAPLCWGLHQAEVVNVWQNGRVALLGDAAHPTLPFLAQGANMAIEDAFLLAELVARHGLAALPMFQRRRQPRTRRLVAAAELNGRIYHARGPARIAIETGLRLVSRAAPGLLNRRYAWIHDYDAAADVT